jgi:integrase
LTLGLRRGELLGLRWSAINLDAGQLRIVATVQRVSGKLLIEEPKTRSSVRTLPVPAMTITALRGQRVRQAARRLAAGPRWRDHDLVFTSVVGTPIDPRNFDREFKELLDSAGVPRIRFHDLRHTFATFLLAEGTPARVVMELLGHSQIGITMNTYAHVLPALSSASVEAVATQLGVAP